jgi:hypothetical protein
MTAHQYAALFPLMSDAEIESLAADIKEHGQRDPIITLDGEILDGRNRYRACEIAKVEPWLQAYPGDDPLGFVVSHNLHRRHLTESQRGMIAAKLASLAVGQKTKGKCPSSGGHSALTHEQAAGLLSVGTSTIRRAKNVQQNGVPELVKAVECGTIKLATAETISELTEQEQKEAIDGGPDVVRQRVYELRNGAAPRISPPTNGTKRLPSYQPTDAPEIWQQARITLDRILPNDKHRTRILNEIVEYCEKRLNTNS